MSKEAMKLALEALKQIDEAMPFPVAKLAQSALRKALASEAIEQPAQQKPFGYIKPGEGDYEKVFSWNRNERNGYTQAVYTTPQPQPAQQEPVAWRVWRGDAYELFFSKYAADRRADCFTKRPDVEPLYTSPQAQRTWVEVEQVKWEGSKLIAKLKEKNT